MCPLDHPRLTIIPILKMLLFLIHFVVCGGKPSSGLKNLGKNRGYCLSLNLLSLSLSLTFSVLCLSYSEYKSDLSTLTIKVRDMPCGVLLVESHVAE